MEDATRIAFDAASRAILEMNQELEELKIKFGERSQLVIKRVAHINAIIDMQDIAAAEINAARQALELARINGRASDLLLTSFATGMHTDRLIRLMRPHEED